MADPVYKIVDVVGTSQQSISNAIGNAIRKASGTLRNLGWFEVEQIRGDIRDGKVNRYQVTLRVGYHAGVAHYLTVARRRSRTRHARFRGWHAEARQLHRQFFGVSLP